MTKIFLVTIAFFLMLCTVIFSGDTVYAYEPYISLSISPAYPRPGETFTASLLSYTVDLNRATITWYINDIPSGGAQGMTNLSVPVETAGETISVRATIAIDNAVYEKTFSVVPGSIDLLWEAPQTYTPPFYRGKALPASGALIKVVAVPHILTEGTHIDADNLIYSWSRNSFKRDVRSQSGYGRSMLTMKKDILLPNETIAVEVLSQSGVYGASAAITIPEAPPTIIMYQNHPLYGVQYQTSLGAIIEKNSEESESVEFAAEPYFFSLTNNTLSSLTFQWSVNGNTVAPNWDNPGHITLGIAKGVEGTTLARLSVTAPYFLLQEASQALSIIFNTDTTRDFFTTP